LQGFSLLAIGRGDLHKPSVFSTRTRDDFHYEEELYRLAGEGKLDLRAAFTREDMAVRADPEVAGGRFVMEPGKRWRIDEEMLGEQNARVLWDLLRGVDEGDRGGYFYICGRTGFANTVLRALDQVLRRFAQGDEEARTGEARRRLYRLVAQGRLIQEIFTTHSRPRPNRGPTFGASEVARHNNERTGYWLMIRRRVYDVTEFAQMHPGGFKVLRGYAGTDATRAYRTVRHDASPEVDAMLGKYEIGAIRRLRFGKEWGVALEPGVLRFVPLGMAFKAWVRMLYLVTEMENALENDWSIRGGATTRDERPNELSPYKVRLLIDVHRRFLQVHLTGIADGPLQELWMLTSGLCAPDTDVRWIGERLAAVRGSEAAARVHGIGAALERELDGLAREETAPKGSALRSLAKRCRFLEAEDRRVLGKLKALLTEGVRVFETLEEEAVRKGSDRLYRAVRGIPGVFEGYYARVLQGISRTGAGSRTGSPSAQR